MHLNSACLFREQALSKTPRLVLARDALTGLTPVHVAARLNWSAGLEALLHAAVPSARAQRHAGALDARTLTGQTPLMLACQADAADAAGVLLARGANARAQDAGGRMALHYCAYYGAHAALKTLLGLQREGEAEEKGMASPVLRNSGGTPEVGGGLRSKLRIRMRSLSRPLGVSAPRCALKLSLSRSSSIALQPPSPSLLSSTGGTAPRAPRLFSLDEEAIFGLTPLHFAVVRGDVTSATLLLLAGANLLARCRGISALALKPPEADAGKTRASPRHAPVPRWTARSSVLHLAAPQASPELLRLLLRHALSAGLDGAADPRLAKDARGQTALAVARDYGRSTGVCWLLAPGTPLEAAASDRGWEERGSGAGAESDAGLESGVEPGNDVAGSGAAVAEHSVSRPVDSPPSPEKALRARLLSELARVEREGVALLALEAGGGSREAESLPATCPVCLEMPPLVAVRPCTHSFCALCALLIVQEAGSSRGPSCPLCRRKMAGFCCAQPEKAGRPPAPCLPHRHAFGPTLDSPTPRNASLCSGSHLK